MSHIQAREAQKLRSFDQSLGRDPCKRRSGRIEEAVAAAWVAHNGLDKQKFISTYQSPEIQAKLDATRKLMRSYEIRGVPTIVVDGKYLTSARMTGGTTELMRVVDELVALARKERAK